MLPDSRSVKRISSGHEPCFKVPAMIFALGLDLSIATAQPVEGDIAKSGAKCRVMQ